jgi:hypothetical protein
LKSYCLESVSSRVAAIAALDATLPKSDTGTWLLKAKTGDVMAYFSFVDLDVSTRTPMIQADISGRHFLCDSEVLSILQILKVDLGGKITNDA